MLKTSSAKRASYSFFDVTSVCSQRRVRFPSRALEQLFIELETTPGIVDCDYRRLEIPYLSGADEKMAMLDFSLTRRDDSRPHSVKVQLIPGSGSENERLAVEAASRYCARERFEHLVVRTGRSPQGPFELQNRRAAHAWLARATTWVSMKLEQQLIEYGRSGKGMLSEAEEYLSLTHAQARVVFLRCWLRGELAWDVGAQSLLADLPVRGVGHV